MERVKNFIILNDAILMPPTDSSSTLIYVATCVKLELYEAAARTEGEVYNYGGPHSNHANIYNQHQPILVCVLFGRLMLYLLYFGGRSMLLILCRWNKRSKNPHGHYL